jgi:hypothetical protein
MERIKTIGKVFGNILLSRILISEVSGRGLLRHEQFGFRPKHSKPLQLARIERVSMNLARSGTQARSVKRPQRKPVCVS